MGRLAALIPRAKITLAHLVGFALATRRVVAALLRHPLADAALAAVLIVLGWRMNAVWANALLLVAWGLFITAVFQFQNTLAFPARARTTGLSAIIIGAILYLTLWTGNAPIDLTAAEDTAVRLPAGSKIGSIVWRDSYTWLSVLVRNDTDTDFSDLDLVLEPEAPVAEATQVGDIPDVSMWRASQFAVTLGSGNDTLPLVMIAGTDGYRVRCPTLPSNSSLQIVLALVKVKESEPDPSIDVKSNKYSIKGQVTGGGYNTLTFWWAYPDHDEFEAGATSASVFVSGSFVAANRRQTVSKQIMVER